MLLSESPLVLCGIVPTDWLHDNMAQLLLEKPDGGYGWSTKLGRSLTVPELRSLLILRYEVGCVCFKINFKFLQLMIVYAGVEGET